MSDRFSINQAALALGVSERTLRRHIKAGKIEAVKDQAPGSGGSWFIERPAIDQAPGSGGSWFIERPAIEALRGCPPKEEEEAVPKDEALPEVLSRLLLRMDELATHGEALEERIATLEREWAAQREGEREPHPRTLWPFRRKTKDEVPQPT